MKGKPPALYRTWHGFAPARVERLPDVNTREMVQIGEALRLDYASHKWSGKVQEYTHDFEKTPRVLATTDGRALLILFDPPRRFVTKRGLVG